MAIKWEGNIEKRRIALLNEGKSYNQIAYILSDEFKTDVGYYAVQGRCRTTNTQIKDVQKDKMNAKGIVKTKKVNLFPDELYENDRGMLYRDVKEHLSTIHNKFNKIKPKKILVMSDLHVPFANFNAIEQAINNEQDADVVVLNGDVFDLFSFSRFDKWEDIDIQRELDSVRQLFTILFSKFKYVVWVGGNHDLSRFKRYLMKAIIPALRGLFIDPRQLIQKEFANYDLILVDNTYAQIGDVVFSHIDTFSNVSMKTVTTASDILRANKNLLPNPNFNGVVMGHTHQMGKVIVNDQLLIEGGCCCHLMDYRVISPTRMAWSTGYSVIYLDDDMHVDFNKSKIVYLKDV